MPVGHSSGIPALCLDSSDLRTKASEGSCGSTLYSTGKDKLGKVLSKRL